MGVAPPRRCLRTSKRRRYDVPRYLLPVAGIALVVFVAGLLGTGPFWP
jgi:hypothetical protein